MVKFNVTEKKIKELKERMKKLNIREHDLEEKFIKSQGKGGQKVNKSSTCVFIKHIPTGVSVKCQKTRNQNLNRFLARRELVEKIAQIYHPEESKKNKKIEKIKKQKRKRRKRALKKLSTDERT